MLKLVAQETLRGTAKAGLIHTKGTNWVCRVRGLVQIDVCLPVVQTAVVAAGVVSAHELNI